MAYLLSKYELAEDVSVSVDAYPCTSTSLIPSLHDAQYYQSLLANPGNFVSVSRCEIVEIGSIGGAARPIVQTIDTSDEDRLHAYLDRSTGVDYKGVLRVIFCTTNFQQNSTATFKHCLSLRQNTVIKMLSSFHVSPQFLPHLLAEPDYWAPGDFCTYDTGGYLQNIEFFCQLPRYDITHRPTAWATYMNYNVTQKSTTYITVCGTGYKPCLTVKRRLAAVPIVSNSNHSLDPFFLHTMILHEALIESKVVISFHKNRLYEQLSLVDNFAKQGGDTKDRAALERLTINLHEVSQDTDSLLASADMAEMIATRLSAAHAKFEALPASQEAANESVKVAASIKYLMHSIQAQKRWLQSYKYRKDIAMNLVFNLVTQQDSATNTVIARETKADSSSMKTIAALTMVFLPGTFISSVFSMQWVTYSSWFIYVAITLPLTGTVILTWWLWTTYPIAAYVGERWKRDKSKKPESIV